MHVEHRLAPGVERQPDVDVPARRAAQLQLRQKMGVDRGVGAAAVKEVVQPVLQEEARRRSDRVRRWKNAIAD